MRILRRRKATLLWITCLGVLVTLAVTSGQSRLFQSRALLEVQAFNEDFLNLRDIYSAAASSVDTDLYPQTDLELLQQDLLIEQVARKLHLEGLPEFQPPPTFLTKLHQYIKIVPLRNSRIIQIICDARNASLAAHLANTLAQTFIEQRTETRQRTAQQTYESLRLQLEELRSAILRQEALARRSVADGTGEPFLRKMEANRRLYGAMLQRANDARIASGVRQSNIRLIAPAVPASLPYKPNLPLNLVIGTLGGFVLAIGCVMLQEQDNSALQSPGEAGAYLALPELGVIPDDGARKSSALRFYRSSNVKLRIERAVLEQRSSYLAESFRTTLASILSAPLHGGHPHILVFTSPQTMEGKTTVVSNLGLALAETGRPALLIDADLRRPQLHRIFDQANGWGLSDVLREWDSLEALPLKALVKKTAVPNLYLLPGGTPTCNISGLLYSNRMSKLLASSRQTFDYVLVDAPPCLEFADARNMARYADGLVLIVRANHTDRKTAQAAVRQIEGDGIRMTGVILNGRDPARSDPCGYPGFPCARPSGNLVNPSEKDWKPIL
jgi:receptor protein-tyrosine kinase